MSFTRPGVQVELDRFFKNLAGEASSFDSATKSAFTQSRKKLDPQVFVDLNQKQLAYFEEHAPNQRLWKQKRVIGIDGSLLNLPHSEEIREVFGSVKNQYEEIMGALCSFAYDVCNELIIDAVIDHRKSCEHDLAVQHLEKLNPEQDILLFDRGYPSLWLMGLLAKKGFKFCIRLSTSWKSAYRLLETTDDVDWTVVFDRKRSFGKLKEYDLPKTLSGLRLVAVPLANGEKEVLVTNLTDRSKYSLSDLKTLYHLRWGVEESFKSFKKTLHIEHFTGKSALAVLQDFYARILMLNLASMLRSQGVSPIIKGLKTKKVYQVNKTQSIAKLKDFIVDLLYRPKTLEKIQQLIQILTKRLEIVRPNRSFPRPCTAYRRRSKSFSFI